MLQSELPEIGTSLRDTQQALYLTVRRPVLVEFRLSSLVNCFAAHLILTQELQVFRPNHEFAVFSPAASRIILLRILKSSSSHGIFYIFLTQVLQRFLYDRYGSSSLICLEHLLSPVCLQCLQCRLLLWPQGNGSHQTPMKRDK